MVDLITNIRIINKNLIGLLSQISIDLDILFDISNTEIFYIPAGA